MKVRPSTPGRENEGRPGEARLRAVSELFAVLSKPTRLRILQMLQDGPARVGQIVDTL